MAIKLTKNEQKVLDPLQVNINIAALGGYYLINQHTLGLVYHISMVSPQALEARRKVIKETILSWLLVDPSSTAHELNCHPAGG